MRRKILRVSPVSGRRESCFRGTHVSLDRADARFAEYTLIVQSVLVMECFNLSCGCGRIARTHFGNSHMPGISRSEASLCRNKIAWRRTTSFSEAELRSR